MKSKIIKSLSTLTLIIIIHFIAFKSIMYFCDIDDDSFERKEIYLFNQLIYSSNWTSNGNITSNLRPSSYYKHTAWGLQDIFGKFETIVDKKYWTDQLKTIVKKSNKIIIEPQVKSLFKQEKAITQVSEIKDLINNIDIVNTDSCEICLCLGDYKIRFYNQDIVLAELIVHHNENMSNNHEHWGSGWGGSLDLTQKSKEYLENHFPVTP